MLEPEPVECPECQDALDRRHFIKTTVGAAAAVATVGVAGAPALASTNDATLPAAYAARIARPAEAMVRELYESMSAEQRQNLVMPWNHGQTGTQLPTRMRMYNAPIGRNIGAAYSRTQQELVGRILRAICSDEEGYRRISRNGDFDGSGSLQGCGANIFGDPTTNQWCWLFTGHHLTVRCDGDSQPDYAFGGPMYYGHSPDGYSQRNVWNYQTQAVRSVFDALSEQQRRTAVITGPGPGEQYPSVQFRAANQARPGIPASELTRDQRRLVETVMRTILSPYRRQDADEVMEIVRRNGGLDRIHLAFYRDRNAQDNVRWNFWRLEGPGFVWNYRVLPHVHTFVNIAVRA